VTDRYSIQCRDIDVCGLTPAGNKRLHTEFWHWRWDRAPQPLDVTTIAKELRAARVVMIDGPQALARKGTALRVCERQSAAVGKTPDTRPSMNKPFAGFICSSLELFTALKGEGIIISPPLFIGVSEVYPGHIWTILSRGQPLPQKATDSGRLTRKLILEALGVCGLPVLPSHDQNDASVAALIAAAADNQISGLSALSIGAPLSVDRDGTLREGPMIIPQLTDAAADRIAHAVRDIHLPEPPSPRLIEAAPAPSDVGADDLLALFIAKAAEGDPQVCTYAWAYRVLFNTSYDKFSQAYARQVIDLACRTHPRELPGLGLVRLDAFIVSKKDGVPSDGYWPFAHHGREEWERVLGNARILG
jgi:predicted nuclease with RNAse H fold